MSTDYEPGTVVLYKSERDNRWCREGMALADSRGILFDTFWASMSDAHRLTADEITTVSVLFNLGDYRELPHGSRQTWKQYAPEDRQVVTSQHGLQRRWFVRNGSEPDLPTRIQNARDEVAEAESALASAERTLEWKRQDLAKLEAQA